MKKARILSTINSKILLRYLVIVILGILFLAHLPFISADPDINISYSRDAFTDEGLNTIQVRNLINHNYLSVTECDNLLKTPLFGSLVSLPFAVFGTNLEVGRLVVLLFIMFSLLIIARDDYFRGIILVFALITLLQYEVFQYSHFVLAEMISVVIILWGIYFYYKACNQSNSVRNFIFASILISLAYYSKIQFLYIIPLLPLSYLLYVLFRSSIKVYKLSNLGMILMVLTAMGLLYLFFWYLPFREKYTYMISNQSGFFEISNKTLEYIDFNFRYYFINDRYLWHFLSFCILLPISVVIYKRSSTTYKILYPLSLLWILLELHKLVMVYLPSRYLVSLYCASGFFIALIIREILFKLSLYPSGLRNKLKISIATLIVLVITIININDYIKVLQRRTFAIKSANEYIAQGYEGKGPVLGAWAPSLTWKSDARALPVWDAFLNYKEPIAQFNPEIVIAESDEEDSNQAYLKQGIDLKQSADSSKSFTIGKWNVVIYWMKY